MAAPQAVAKRNGAWAQLPVRELVQGDVIALKGGDVIPADCRVRCRALMFRLHDWHLPATVNDHLLDHCRVLRRLECCVRPCVQKALSPADKPNESSTSLKRLKQTAHTDQHGTDASLEL